jgi:cytochrome oxidase assembly protein ShyY1
VTVLAALSVAALLLLLLTRLAVWQVDREYEDYRRATAAVFDRATPLIRQGRYAEAQALVDEHMAKRRRQS